MEMVQDIMQGLVTDHMEIPPHCFEEYMSLAKVAKHSKNTAPPKAYICMSMISSELP
jgi:hypothetical protein